MFPVHQAFSFEMEAPEGGSTKPWIVNVETEDTLTPFVVKTYKVPNRNYRPQNKDFLVSALAGKFGLTVPEAALIKLPESFVSNLPQQKREKLDQIGASPKFGCRYLSGAPIFSPALLGKTLEKEDLENLYAFDHLIGNEDRYLKKPNLLLMDGKPILIDHEKCFSFTTPYLVNEAKKGNFIFWGGRLKSHICLPALSKTRGVSFDEFGEFLSRFDLSLIKKVQGFCEENGMEADEFELILDYFRYLKQKPQLLIKKLKNNIKEYSDRNE